ncbi:IS4 family transposase [Geodermatophilus sp. DF01-2]|nr:IS4 family transposase [Geodermatophilus sp. DF01_2]
MPKSATLAVPAVASSAAGRDDGGSLSAALPAEKGLPLRLGVLTEHVRPELVDEVVAATGRVQRRCRLLPARAVVYFVLALCLYSAADAAGPPGYRSVLRSQTTGLRQLRGLRLPTRAAPTRARRRLGAGALQALFARLCGPLAAVATLGVFAFGRRVVAFDGTGLDVADTPANVEASGRAGDAGHPQLRLLALIECGTHAALAAAFDGFYAASEQVLARRVLAGLRPGMLLLADRNFPGYQLWGAAAATGADLVWRVKKNTVFIPVRRLGQIVPVGHAHPRRRPAPRPGPVRRPAAARPTRGPPGADHRLHRHRDRRRRQPPGRVVPAGHHPARPSRGAGGAADRAVSRALGERGRLRRDQDPAPRRRIHPALPHTRAGPPGNVRLPRRQPGPVRDAHGRRGDHRHRSRPDLLHHHRPPGPRPARHHSRRHPGHPAAGPPAGHHRPARRPASAPTVTNLPAGQATPQGPLPDQTTQPDPTTEQGQLHAHHHRRRPHLGKRHK